MAETEIKLLNYTGKELCLYSKTGEVIYFPKQDTSIPSNKKKISELPNIKIKKYNTNFGDIVIPNFCPLKSFPEKLPKFKSGIFYIVLPEIAMRYKRIDFVYPEYIIFQDEFHINFECLGFFHF